jgi:hypothetical protein
VPVIPNLYPKSWLESKYLLNKKLPIKIKKPNEKSDFKFNNGYFAESINISRIFIIEHPWSHCIINVDDSVILYSLIR